MSIWHKDLGLEAEFEKEGISFIYRPEHRISALKVNQSLKNNARMGSAINDDVVLEYATAMENKKSFPAIVITPQGYILAGNHRVKATVTAGYKTVAAYEVRNGTNKVYDILTRMDNARHGLGLSIEERVQHALHLSKEHSLPMTECANRMNVKPELVIKAGQTNKMREFLEDAGIDASNFSGACLLKLHTIGDLDRGHNRKVLLRLGTVIIKEKLTAEDAGALITHVKRVNTEAQQLNSVDEWCKTYLNNKPQPTIKNTPANRLYKLLSGPASLHEFLTVGNHGKKFNNLDQFMVPPENLAALKESWLAIKQILDPIMKEVPKK